MKAKTNRKLKSPKLAEPYTRVGVTFTPAQLEMIREIERLKRLHAPTDEQMRAAGWKKRKNGEWVPARRSGIGRQPA